MPHLEKLIWFNTIFAIFGTYLNAKQIRSGFIIWMLTNAVFMAYNIYMSSYAQATLFGVYFGLALFGWINWGKQPKEEPVKAEVEAEEKN